MYRIDRSARLLALAGVLFLSRPTLAQVAPAPSLVSFQGRLTTPSGTPVADGSNYTVTVSLWDAATGGTQKWSQTLTNVPVKNGVFSALLTTDTAGLFNGTGLWLQVAVAGDPAMTPRQQIASVPFAIKANTVPDNAIGSQQIGSDAASLNKVTGGALSASDGKLAFTKPGTDQADAGKLDYRGFDASSLSIVGAGTAFPNRNVRLWDTLTLGYSGVSGGVAAFNGNVGIGTSSPSAPLHVSTGLGFPAAALISSTNTNGTWLQLANTSTGGRGWSLVSTGSGNGEGAGNLLWYDHGDNGPRMLLTNTGRLGIGTTNPTETLTVNGRLALTPAAGDQADSGKLDYRVFDGNSLSIVGAGTTNTNRNVRVFDTLSVGYTAPSSGVAAFNGNVGIGTASPSSELDVNGEITAKVVTVLGGSDVAEPYHVAEVDGVKPMPGMVVVMDSEKVGQMKVASHAYDPAVGGILSGANGVNPGLTLRQRGTVADGELPVASVGRVWCYADADANGPIATGTLLTTSDTPGYAMRVTDFDRANGCIIGKAMSSLASGRGLVLVLVSLK